MANLNKVLLIGNLTRDPELRYLQNGTAVCDFGLAVNRNWRTPGGEQKEEVLFIDVTAWAKQAEVVSEFLQKGRPVFVEGRLKLDQWTAQDGQKRSRVSVVMERFQFLDARGAGAGGGAAEGGASRRKDAPQKDVPQKSTPQKDAAQKPPAAENNFDSGDDSTPF